MVVGGSVKVKECHLFLLAFINGLFIRSPFAYMSMSPIVILSTAKVTRFMSVNGTYSAGVKYVSGSFRLVSVDLIEKPDLTQELVGGNGALWKYGSGPRFDGTIARHFKACAGCKPILKTRESINTYISNHPEASKICISNLGYFCFKGTSGTAEKPVRLPSMVRKFKCYVHNTNPISFDSKIVVFAYVVESDPFILCLFLEIS